MSAETRRVVLAWAPAAIYMAVIWTVSSMEQPTFPVHLFPMRDKGVHTTEYAALAFFFAHALLRTFDQYPRARVALVAILLTGLWGFLDEMHQAFVPGRSADVLDLVADTLGGLVGTAARMALAMAGARTRAARGATA